MTRHDKFIETEDGTMKLAPGVFMQWSIEHGGSGNPVEYFEKEYGYMPTEYAIADDVDLAELQLPHSLSQSIIIIGKVQPGHILLR